MGQDNTKQSQYGSKEDEVELKLPSPEEAERQIQRARMRIATFRARAGTSDICATLLSSWQKEKSRIEETWSKMSDPARRAMIMNIRESVLLRAKILHNVVEPRALRSQQKAKAVRKLMEKVAFELFDTNIVYDNVELPRLVEDILTKRGGGPQVPFGLGLEVSQTFDAQVRRFSKMSVNNSLDAAESTSTSSKGSDEENSSQMVNARSASSLQGYFSTDMSKTARHNNGSRTIEKLLSFIPEAGLDPATRKQLTLELLLEMRNAFLVHFAILVFSELFDDKDAVLHKYEYDSDSDTDVGFSDTDIEEEESEDSS
mmetsp:Transcript_16288/g.28857  ORF Transcript_16288/g.28857 Transcript_16288/m.28857 type:complete len:315 (+) Transcript_16288:309-1253(+)|eukprot:CAMPEP_0184523450 /NCGR_PEP_ID=MMETSP0198_2-20121128/8894_1 /TAXON_ID=1112570 /ORGANISM="Thraustochytrium sp., Strain LLF1b" /LENGTH=314 /DNA_ID=CAMNT_0026914489 /DNA_START=297 /DNA_END=1241 /DNA_ORIENTATION=-